MHTSLALAAAYAALSLPDQDRPHQVQSDPDTALAAQARIAVGDTVAIESRFAGLPLVEPHVSAHPADDEHLLVAAMVVTDVDRPYESCRLSSFVSSDGGQHWSETAHDWWGYDPWTVISTDGRTSMSWLGTPGEFGHRFPVQLFSSDDGGLEWSADVQTLAGNHDGTKLVALGDDVYFTTVRFRDDMGADVVMYRRSGTAPFEEVARIDGKGARLNFCEPAVLTDGTVLVPASHYLTSAWVQHFDPESRRLSDGREITRRPGGARGYMRLVADTSSDSPFTNRVYFVRALGSGAAPEGVWLNYSTDGGITWSEDLRVDRFPGAGPGAARLASVAINGAGVVGISWVDRRHDPAGHDVYFAASGDGGLTFTAPERITDISSDPRTEQNADVANKFFGGGHYLGLATRAGGAFQLVWSDSRSGVFELQTCRVGVDG